MRKYQYDNITTRLIQKIAYSHDPESAEIAAAISDLNSQLFEMDKKFEQVRYSALEFCTAFRQFISKDRQTGDDLFDLFNKQNMLLSVLDALEEE